ncbi:MAG: hypothetical protein HY751_08405 [Nitrospinae bacterium]|nr:hypothetical protein [Nitrospinota bacterium]
MSGESGFSQKKEFEVKALPMEEKKRLIAEGKAHWFFPHHVLEQVIICGVVLMILVTLSTVVPAHLGPKADPFDTPAHIKPEWYFLAAFYSLKVAQYLEFLGSWAPKLLGIVMQGVAVMVLLAAPFIDRGGKERDYRKRPVAMIIGGVGAFIVVLFSILGAVT